MSTESAVPRVLSPDVRSHPLESDELDPSDVVAGAPATASAGLAELGGIEVGIWEITEGTVRDTEADEIFVVLSGSGTVTFEDGAVLELGPGIAVRLRAGERTVWEIRDRLRKIYVV
ncbi:hypothetical protein CLV56_2222 [Mumia flava]|uniref:(S)-ureidoglycine aminohydrolase cupin domain-containing protein n=1 Tax=Mumia flava TaxID=1348852 RepID=A0A0B2BUB1_9ACTN|nr:cupin domain-containing protein [Mumia flava]PJJ57979.1 hypothetical protein CLV56_2222 [Mumia flava]